MRVLVLLALALAAPLAEARALVFHLEATDEGFVLRGGAERNPSLEVEAGDEVTLRFLNRATAAHNVHLGPPLNLSTPCCQARGDEAVLQFVAPNVTGGIPYWSDADPDAYRGVLLVGDPVPRVRIVAPAEGADVPPTFEVRIEVENFVLEPFPAGTEPVRGRGHVRYLLDGGNASTLTDRLTHSFVNVPVGHHVVRAELIGRDGMPLEPPVAAEVFVYRPPESPTLPDGAATTTTPTEPSPTPFPGVLAALAALAIVARSRRPRR